MVQNSSIENGYPSADRRANINIIQSELMEEEKEPLNRETSRAALNLLGEKQALPLESEVAQLSARGHKHALYR